MYVEVPIIGTGTRRNPFRPQLRAGVPFSAWMLRDPQTGQPLQSTCLVHLHDREAVPVDGRVFAKDDVTLLLHEKDPMLQIEQLVARDEIQRSR